MSVIGSRNPGIMVSGKDVNEPGDEPGFLLPVADAPAFLLEIFLHAM